MGSFAVGLVQLAVIVLAPVLWLPLYLFQHGMGAVQVRYPTILEWALGRRALVITLAFAGFVGCWLVLVPQLGRELIPQVHQGEFNLNLFSPVGTPLDQSFRVLAQVEEIALKLPQVELVAATAGTEKTATSAAEEGEHTGRITIRLKEEIGADAEVLVIEKLRRDLAAIPALDVEISRPALFSFKTPVEVEIRGHELQSLRGISRRVEHLLASIPGLADVASSLQQGNPELQIRYDRRRLAEYGLNLRSVAEMVRNKVQGRVATDLRQGDRNIDVLVRLRQSDRFGPEHLRRLVVNPNEEVPIYLEAVADIEMNEGPNEIRRIDQQRAAMISANVRDIDLGSASELIDAAMRTIDFPPGFSFLITGQNAEMEKSLRSLLFALALAIFLVYVVMASQFESLLHPFIIICTVSLAAVGVVCALSVAQIALSIVVFIGLIMLAGIVVNNAIVLVDYVNTLRRGGMDRQTAIITAASVRLRPILMTTTTTVLALLPMALGLGEGAEIRVPMALTVIAGLISSTLLTLILIPTVYSVVDRSP